MNALGSLMIVRIKMDYYTNHNPDRSDSIFYKPKLKELGFSDDVKWVSSKDDVRKILKAHGIKPKTSTRSTIETTLGTFIIH
jgi:hypothetical protein